MKFKQVPTYSNTYPCHVLIVDDDPFHRTLVCELLALPKYEITEASSGIEALDALRSRGFDMVLLDKHMPGMDGDEVCRRIRGELGLTMLPILMVTGNGDIDNLTQSLSAGANDFLRKPYDPAELLARLDAAVYRKRLTDQLDCAESMLFALARMVEAKDAKGWRDPELTAIFLNMVRTRPEALDAPAASTDDLGLNLFSTIRSTGALDWDSRLHT